MRKIALACACLWLASHAGTLCAQTAPTPSTAHSTEAQRCASPFQSAKGGRWGMINDLGQVVCTSQFDSLPTVAYNNRFWVPTADDQWQLYSLAPQPQKLGTPVLAASPFYSHVATVVRKGQPVEVIDTLGQTRFRLDTLAGKAVKYASFFSENGISIVTCMDESYGVVNAEGQTVIPPTYHLLQYSHGTFMGIPLRYKAASKQGDWEQVEIDFLDLQGRVIGHLNSNAYDKILGGVAQGVYKVQNSVADPNSYAMQNSDVAMIDSIDATVTETGLINCKGEVLLPPTTDISDITELRGHRFIYAVESKYGEKYGLRDLEGNILIAPQYDNLVFANDPADELFIATEGGTDLLLNLRGEKVARHSYPNIVKFTSGSSKTVAQLSQNDWTLLDCNGQEHEPSHRLYQLDASRSENPVYSQVFDPSAFLSAFAIGEKRIGAYHFDTPAPQLLQRLYAQNDAELNDWKCSTRFDHPEDFVSDTTFMAQSQLEQARPVMFISYAKSVGQRVKVKGKKPYYRFTAATPESFLLMIPPFESGEAQSRAIYDGLLQQLQQIPEVSLVQEGHNGVVYKKGKYYYALAYHESLQSIFVVITSSKKTISQLLGE